ncbi:hypothetical protein MY10362_002322 [Beauveria mimosiformis]
MPCPSHDSKILKTRQPPCVHAPEVSMPSGGILAAARRGRGSGRDVRRTNAGVGRRRPPGRSHRSTAGRTDKNTNDDIEDDDGKGSNDGGVDVEEDGARSRYLACPFYKFDPARHFRCYCRYQLKRYSDVKVHILRCHNLGTLYCSKCWRTWNNNEFLLWENHASQNPPCQFVPEPESLLPREATALKELDVMGLSEYEKWYRMWDLLFMSHQRPPSPYMEPGFGEVLLLIGHSHDSLLRELPLLLLEIGIQVDHQAVQYLGNRIDSIYRQSLIPGHSQSPRYRRQHAIQQQQQEELQMQMQPPQQLLQMQEPQLQQPQAAGVESAAITATMPAQLTVDDIEVYDVLRNMDGLMDEYIHQDASLDDMMQFFGDGNNLAPESPPPPLPCSSKEKSLENLAAPQVLVPNVAKVKRPALQVVTAEETLFDHSGIALVKNLHCWLRRFAYFELGSPDANYKICGSRLPRSSAGFFLDQVVISAGSMITGGAVLTPGVKELPPHLTRNGTIPQLKWLSKRYIVLWDEEVKRGWLVNGTSALLHIMRASLAQSEHDDSSACLMFDKSKMNNFPDKSYKHNTAMRVLIDQGNQGLVVYPDSISQTRKTSADSGNSTNTQTSTYFLFGDLAKKHFAALEQMIDYHSHLAGRDGINLKIRLRKHLEGWDFVDLVNEIRPQPHVATIPTLGHGWIDFVRSIEAITLFGRKFGELLQPASRTGLCDRWSSLPQQDYLLAASVADLTSIMEQYGDPHAAPRELARNIIWHSPADTYAACPCKLSRASRHEKAAAYHVGPVQVLLPSGRLPPASGLRELEPDGAVAFGHNAIFGYRWPEKGTDEVPAKDFLVPLRNMLPVRLSKPQAESLDTLESSETDVASRIDSESSSSTPWVESPPSLRSSLRSLIPKRRNCTLQEENETVKKKLKTK